MKSIIALWLAMLVAPVALALDWQTALEGAHRTPENSARDASHQRQRTLEFFGLQDGMIVAEIASGGDTDKAMFAAVGESNRVSLKFTKAQ